MKNPLQRIILREYRRKQKKRCQMPRFWVAFARRINVAYAKKKYGDSYVPIETYDGSAQLTHPDIECFRGNKYLVATPYPYGCESYENPCIYQWIGDRWEMICGPVCKPTGTHEHYSDPELAVWQDELYLFFRKTDRKEKKDYIYVIKSQDAINWSDPTEVLRDEENAILSPAILINECWKMYSIRYKNHQSEVEVRKSDDGIVWSEPQIVKFSNMPNDGYAWHITACREGLILLVKSKTSLYKGLYLIHEAEQMELSVHISFPVENSIRNPYKCAYDPQNKSLIIPVRDFYDRWFLYEHKWSNPVGKADL